MSARGNGGYLNLSASLTQMAGHGRGRPLPQCERRPLPVALIADGPEVPEMTTDVIDPSAGYSAGNVRRGPGTRRNHLGSWMERVLGGHRAARL